MLNLSPVKLLVVLIIAMLLLGPDKLPQVARQLGAAWRSFRTFQRRIEHEVRESLPDLPNTVDLARMARSPVALLNQLAEMPSLDDDDFEPAVPDPGAQASSTGEDGAPWPADAAADGDERAGAAGRAPMPTRSLDQAHDRDPSVDRGQGDAGSGPDAVLPELAPVDWPAIEGAAMAGDPSMN